MGYRVDYGSDAKYQTDKASSLRIFVITVAFFLAFCLAVNTFFPRGREAFWEALFPGRSAAAQNAVEVFVDELSNGESVSGALGNLHRALFENEDPA